MIPQCTGVTAAPLSKCCYQKERWIIFMAFGALAGTIWTDIRFVYGLADSPSGTFEHYKDELVKVSGWFIAELERHSGEWRGMPPLADGLYVEIGLHSSFEACTNYDD